LIQTVKELGYRLVTSTTPYPGAAHSTAPYVYVNSYFRIFIQLLTPSTPASF